MPRSWETDLLCSFSNSADAEPAANTAAAADEDLISGHHGVKIRELMYRLMIR